MIYIENAGCTVILLHFFEIVNNKIINFTNENHILIIFSKVIIFNFLIFLITLFDNSQTLWKTPLVSYYLIKLTSGKSERAGLNLFSNGLGYIVKIVNAFLMG